MLNLLLPLLILQQETIRPAIPLTVRPATAAPSNLPPPPALLKAGDTVPDFTVDAPGGTKKVSLASLKGKVVVLDFWATWCGPCKASMPHLEEVWKKLKTRGDATVLALCTSDERPLFEKWVVENKDKYTFPYAYDPAGRDNAKKLSRNVFGVTGIPTTFVIGKDGKVVDAIVGYSAGDHSLEAALKKAGVDIGEVGGDPPAPPRDPNAPKSVPALALTTPGANRTSPPPAAKPPKAAPMPKPGELAPNALVELPSGAKVELASLKGKVVILDFWATWCGPCLASFPHLESVWQKLKGRDDATVLAINVFDERGKYDTWRAATKYTFPLAFDSAGRDMTNSVAYSRFGVSIIPVTFVIGKDGKVVASLIGNKGPEDHRLEEALKLAGIE